MTQYGHEHFVYVQVPTDTNLSSLIVHFGNKTKSGGGDIVEEESKFIGEKEVLICFEEPSVASQVLQKGSKQNISSGGKVRIERCTPELLKRKSAKNGHSPSSSCVDSFVILPLPEQEEMASQDTEIKRPPDIPSVHQAGAKPTKHVGDGNNGTPKSLIMSSSNSERVADYYLHEQFEGDGAGEEPESNNSVSVSQRQHSPSSRLGNHTESYHPIQTADRSHEHKSYLDPRRSVSMQAAVSEDDHLSLGFELVDSAGLQDVNSSMQGPSQSAPSSMQSNIDKSYSGPKSSSTTHGTELDDVTFNIGATPDDFMLHSNNNQDRDHDDNLIHLDSDNMPTSLRKFDEYSPQPEFDQSHGMPTSLMDMEAGELEKLQMDQQHYGIEPGTNQTGQPQIWQTQSPAGEPVSRHGLPRLSSHMAASFSQQPPQMAHSTYYPQPGAQSVGPNMTPGYPMLRSPGFQHPEQVGGMPAYMAQSMPAMPHAPGITPEIMKEMLAQVLPDMFAKLKEDVRKEVTKELGVGVVQKGNQYKQNDPSVKFKVKEKPSPNVSQPGTGQLVDIDEDQEVSDTDQPDQAVHVHPEVEAELEENQSQKEMEESDENGLRAREDMPETTEPNRTMEVHGIESTWTEEAIVLFFENKRRSGGGDIEVCDIDFPNKRALITYKDPAVADQVARKKTLKYQGVAMTVCLYQPPKPVHKEPAKLNEQNDLHVPSSATKQKPRSSVPVLQTQRSVSPERLPSLTSSIEVRGFKTSTTDDALKNFFQNRKRSGGSSIQFMEVDTNRTRAVITFDDHGVVRRILSKGALSLEDATLHICEYSDMQRKPALELPVDMTRIFLRGLDSTTTQECLLLFLENLSGVSNENNSILVTYGLTPGLALVSFGQQIEFDTIQNKFRKKKKGEFKDVVIEEVHISNMIQVHNIGPKTTKQSVELYFENNSGTDVIETQMESSFALVTFKDYRAVDYVLKKQHTLDNHQLCVVVYQDCLGLTPPGVDTSVPTLPIPDPIEEKCDPLIMKFLKDSPEHGQLFFDIMTKEHAGISFTDDGNLRLECTLKKEDKDSFNLVKNWRENTDAQLQRFLKRYSVESVYPLQEGWSSVLELMSKSGIFQDTKSPSAIHVNPEKHAIRIYGERKGVKKTKAAVEEITKEVHTELARAKTIVTEKLTAMRDYQLQFLSVYGFTKIIKNAFKDLEVKIELQNGTITFTGVPGDIQTAKVQMYEIITAIVSTTFELSQAVLLFMKSQEVKDFMVNRLKQRNAVVTWTIEQSTLTMFGQMTPDMNAFMTILKTEIMEEGIKLQQESIPVLKMKQWHELVDKIQKQYPGLVQIIPSVNNSQITLVSLTKDFQNIKKDLAEFIKANTVLNTVVPVDYGTAAYIKKYEQNHLNALELELKQFGVRISVNDNKSKAGIQVKGTSDGMTVVKANLQAIVEKIQKHPYPVGKPGMPKFFSEERGQMMLSSIADSAKCIIDVQLPEESRQSSFKSSSSDGPGMVVRSKGQHKSGVMFIVAKGDLTQYQVDVIVNAANERLQHIGGLAGAILQAGGKVIQDESYAAIQQRGRLLEGQVALTSPGKLPCKMIIHGVGPTWKGGYYHEEPKLKEVISRSLNETSGANFRSVAFPAVSSGIFGYPLDKSTKAIMEAADEYCRENSDTKIKEIHFVGQSDNIVTSFDTSLRYILPIASGSSNRRENSNSIFFQEVAATAHDPNDYDTDDEIDIAQGATGGGSKPSAFTPSGPASVTTRENVTVTIVKGMLAQQNAHAIVNTTHHSLDLNNGAVSKSIVAAAGPQLQRECSRKYPNGVQQGDVAVTSSYGNLACQCVYHGACVNWDNGKGQSEQILRTFLQNCLRQAEQDGLSSIAFPAVGTGQLGIPADVVAQVMFDEVRVFSSRNPSSITNVHFVIYPRDIHVINAFDSELKSLASGGSVKLRGTKRRGRKSSKEKQSSSSIWPFGLFSSKGKTKKGSLYTDLTSNSAGGKQIKVGNVVVQVQAGDVTTENVDAIVNSTNYDLDLKKGGVSQAIVRKGGHQILSDCAKLGSTTNGFAVTSGGLLNCKKIIHMDSNYFHGDWKTAVAKCLELSEKKQYQSIVFPALGTGAMNQPPDQTAIAMLEGVAYFYVHCNPSHTLMVRITLFQPHLARSFFKAMENKLDTPIQDDRGLFTKMIDTVTGKQWVGEKALKRDKKTIILEIFADSKSTIDKAVQGIESLIDQEMVDKVIEDEAVAKLTDEQIAKILDLEVKFQDAIKITLENTRNLHRIRIQGHVMHVSMAADQVHAILREVSEAERKRVEAEGLAKVIQWCYEDGGVSSPYDIMENVKIEEAYNARRRSYRFTDEDGKQCEILFREMVEYEVGKKHSEVPVRRKNLQDAYKLPSCWDHMKTGQGLLKVALKQGSQEYNTVETVFINTAQGSVAAVQKIERIQNPTLYKAYLVKKEEIEQRNPSRKNENELFHGTSEDTLDSINLNGFNRSYCGKNAVMYGRGVYFAKQSTYSAQNQYARPGRNGCKHVYLAKVLTGEYVQGNQSLIVPPPRPGMKSVHYDSVVDNPQNPGIFVIFTDNQAYPEYLITFT